jgi:DNA-binding transcriptional regulator YiaG
MPNVAKVLREEIQRLARQQVKAGLGALKRDQVRMKKSVAALRRQLEAMDRASRELAQRITPLVAVEETKTATDLADRLRPTSEGLAKLRRRLGLTQVQFGTLLGVSGPAVVQWEGKGGRVRMRHTTRAALARIQQIGKREARRRLETQAAPEPRRPRRPRP